MRKLNVTFKMVAIVIVCILATAFIVRSFFPRIEDGGWEDMYHQEATAFDVFEKQADAEVEEKEKANTALRAELNGHMDSTATVIAHKDMRIEEQETKIRELKDAADALPEDAWEDKYRNELAQNISLNRIVIGQRAKLLEIGVPEKVGDGYVFPEGSLVFGIIDTYEKRLVIKDEIIANRDDVIARQGALDEAARDSIEGLTRENGKLRRQATWVKIGAGALGAGLVYLAIK